jgi:hypothetical protein
VRIAQVNAFSIGFVAVGLRCTIGRLRNEMTDGGGWVSRLLWDWCGRQIIPFRISLTPGEDAGQTSRGVMLWPKQDRVILS